MAQEYTGFAPFAYNTDYYVYTDREDAEKKKFISFHTQREASYKKPLDEVYNNKHLDDKELLWKSFRENVEPPTPPIKEIDGYKSEEELSSDSANEKEDCDGDADADKEENIQGNDNN